MLWFLLWSAVAERSGDTAFQGTLGEQNNFAPKLPRVSDACQSGVAATLCRRTPKSRYGCNTVGANSSALGSAIAGTSATSNFATTATGTASTFATTATGGCQTRM